MVKLDLSKIPSELVRSILCATVEKQLKSKNYKINVSSASSDGENNFVGVVYRVSFAKMRENETENDESPTHSLILKVTPQNLARRSRFHSRPAFLCEIYMYNKVLPFYRQFEQSKGVAKGNTFNEYPQCYGTGDLNLSEFVLLEDMTAQRFAIIDKCTEEVTADHVRLVMRTLAKFHAISFALKDQQPNKFEELASSLTEHFLNRNDRGLREYLTKRISRVFDVVSDEKDAHLLAKVKKLFERECLDVVADCLDVNVVGSAAIIIHGDTWQNNIMFQYDSNGTPIKISLLDWQGSRYTSPIVDFAYFMFCCTTKDLRDAHYDEFQKLYYESLSANIRRLGSDPEKLFPYDLMLEHFRKFARFGLILANLLLPVMTTESGNGANLDQVAEQYKAGEPSTKNIFITDKTRDKFEKRLRDVVVDLVRLEYI